MKNKKQDKALETPAEANRDKHINFLAEEEGDVVDDTTEDESIDRSESDEADGDNASTEMLPKEIRIDPVIEHSQRTDADDKIFDDDIDRSPRGD